MELEELEKKLHKEKSDIGGRPEDPGILGSDYKEAPKQDISVWKSQPDASNSKLGGRLKKVLKIIAIFLVIIGLGAVGFLAWRSRYNFDSSQVSLSISGTERLTSGENTAYIVRYKNPTRIALQEAKLTFLYPEDSEPVNGKNISYNGNRAVSTINLSDIAPGQDGQIEFIVTVIGLKDEQKKADVELSYKPVNVSSVFKNSAYFSGAIIYVPMIVEFNLPDRAVSGQEITVSLKYHNTSDVSFSDLVLSAEYPSGFNFSAAYPAPNQNSNVWDIKEIGPREERAIKIVGTISGAKDEVKIFKAKIEQKKQSGLKIVSEGMDSIPIEPSPLTVLVQVNGRQDYLASVGEKLNYTLVFQNTTDVPLDSSFINLKFNTQVLDFSTLDIKQGYFDSINSAIIWNESSLSLLKTLQPGQQGTISFSVKVKSSLPIKSFNDKNFLIGVVAKIDTQKVPVSLQGTQIAGFGSIETKINSRLILSSKGYFSRVDDCVMQNTGPLPPVVGQQTTYSFCWKVMNLSNDVDNVIVESYLPPYVHWLNNFSLSDGQIKYDQTTGKITWSLGRLPANAGFFSSPVRLLSFQVGLIPADNQVDQRVTLLKEAVISGVDLFTQAELRSSVVGVESNLPDDPTVGYQNGQIRGR